PCSIAYLKHRFSVSSSMLNVRGLHFVTRAVAQCSTSSLVIPPTVLSLKYGVRLWIVRSRRSKEAGLRLTAAVFSQRRARPPERCFLSFSAFFSYSAKGRDFASPVVNRWTSRRLSARYRRATSFSVVLSDFR